MVPSVAETNVPERTTYAQWLKKQPAAVQDEVLGKTRGKLFRSGKVTIDRMIDPRLRPLTLAELAEREGLDLGRKGKA